MTTIEESIGRLEELNAKLTSLLADQDGRGMASWCSIAAGIVRQMSDIVGEPPARPLIDAARMMNQAVKAYTARYGWTELSDGIIRANVAIEAALPTP